MLRCFWLQLQKSSLEMASMITTFIFSYNKESRGRAGPKSGWLIDSVMSSKIWSLGIPPLCCPWEWLYPVIFLFARRWLSVVRLWTTNVLLYVQKKRNQSDLGLGTPQTNNSPLEKAVHRVSELIMIRWWGWDSGFFTVRSCLRKMLFMD